MTSTIVVSRKAVIFAALICVSIVPCSQAVAAGQEAAIHGVVTWDGDIPRRAPLRTTQDPKCAEMHKGSPLLSDNEIVNEAGQVKNVFVYVDNPPEGDYAPPAEPFTLDQAGCRYEPHVFGIVAGQELYAKNSDNTLHNVRTFGRINRPNNMGQPPGTDPRKTRLHKKEELAIKVKCDVHPWMTAFFFVMSHPFFAVTDENGAFEIAGLPAGEYTVIAWHERWGEQEMTITVGGGDRAHADFVFSK